MYKWFKAHPRAHVLINALVITCILGMDWVVLLQMPHWILRSNGHPGTGLLVATAVLAGALHSWLLYSLAIFTLHEGAAHKLIFPGNGTVQPGRTVPRCKSVPPFGSRTQLLCGVPHGASCQVRHGARFGVSQLRPASPFLAHAVAPGQLSQLQ